MKKNIFLVSYPKSGNTWIRAIISNLLNQNNNFSLKDLKQIQLLSSRQNFKKFRNIVYDKDEDLNFDWTCENIIECQKILNQSSLSHRFYKSHSVRHKKFTNETVNLGFIYIIRDPRDIVISLSKFAGGDIDRSIHELLFSPYSVSRANGVKELLSTWDLHVKSWIDYQGVSRLFLKYEDLLDKTKENILKIIEFINIISNNGILPKNIDIDKVVKDTSFSNLKKLEKTNGFDEASKYSIFFRSGKQNQWKKILSNDQIKLIESKMGQTMQYFNYI